MKTFNYRAKIKLLSGLLVLLFAFSLNTYSQSVFYSKGANVYIDSSAIVRVRGNVETAFDAAGSNTLENTTIYGEFIIDGDFIIGANTTVQGDGIYKVSGDWENNGTFNSDTSIVILEDTSATDQLITGTVSTSFFNLELTGGGIKRQEINSFVTGVLALNDRELATDDYIMFVENTDVSAINFTLGFGFVSSDKIITGDGCLSRQTANSSTYKFPVGSSLITTRYRPVDITPSSVNPHTYTVRLANNDATDDTYNTSSYDSTIICATNSAFYHRINRTSGLDPADIAIYYDSIADGYWDGIAQWIIALAEWVDVGPPVIVTSGVPLYSVTKANWNDFTNDPYILTTAGISVSLGPDTSTCEGGTVTLTAPVGDSYLWSTNEITQQITVDSTGTYSVTVTVGTCTGTDAIDVSINTNPTVDLGADTSTCGVFTLDAGLGYSSYLWTYGSTDQILNVDSSDTYSVTVTDVNGCTDTDDVIVTISASPVVDLGVDTTVCDGNIITLDAGPGPGYTYIWDDASSTTTQTLDVTAAGDYSVTVSLGVCDGIDVITVTFASTPSVNLFDQAVCQGQTATLDAGADGDFYLWNDATTGRYLDVTADGTYYVTVSNDCGNSYDTADVVVYDLPTVDLGPDTIIIVEDSSITLDAGAGFISYIWSSGDTTQTITLSELDEGEYPYSVIVIDSNGCSNFDKTLIIVNEAELIIYNTFTPNNDGVNDTWQIETIELYPGNTVEVYNRNGNLVYKNEEGETMWKWDGKYYKDGKDLPAASYYYIIDLKDGRVFTGVVAIVR